METDQLDHINWSDVLRQNAAASTKTFQAALESTPEPGEVKGLSTDQYALQSAKAQGWREAVNFIFRDFPNQRTMPEVSPFLDVMPEKTEI